MVGMAGISRRCPEGVWVFGAGCAMRMGELRNAHDYHSARKQGRWHYPFFVIYWYCI